MASPAQARLGRGCPSASQPVPAHQVTASLSCCGRRHGPPRHAWLATQSVEACCVLIASPRVLNFGMLKAGGGRRKSGDPACSVSLSEFVVLQVTRKRFPFTPSLLPLSRHRHSTGSTGVQRFPDFGFQFHEFIFIQVGESNYLGLQVLLLDLDAASPPDRDPGGSKTVPRTTSGNSRLTDH